MRPFIYNSKRKGKTRRDPYMHTKEREREELDASWIPHRRVPHIQRTRDFDSKMNHEISALV